MKVRKQVDVSIIIGVLTSSIAIWFFLYSTIIDLTTSEPTAASLLYLGFAHFLSFICVLFSFIYILDAGLDIGLEEKEYIKLIKFQSIANRSRQVLFSLWGFMFVISITSLLCLNLFLNAKITFLKENGGFILGLILSILFFKSIGINIFKLLKKLNYWFIVFSPLVFIVYELIISLYASDVKYKVEKEFYTSKDTVRFELKRKGYIFLPSIDYVVLNFRDTLPQFSSGAYFIDLSKTMHTGEKIIEVTYSPQVLGNNFKKYFYINTTP